MWNIEVLTECFLQFLIMETAIKYSTVFGRPDKKWLNILTKTSALLIFNILNIRCGHTLRGRLWQIQTKM